MREWLSKQRCTKHNFHIYHALSWCGKQWQMWQYCVFYVFVLRWGIRKSVYCLSTGWSNNNKNLWKTKMFSDITGFVSSCNIRFLAFRISIDSNACFHLHYRYLIKWLNISMYLYTDIILTFNPTLFLCLFVCVWVWPMMI